jgi:predicted esterase
MTPEDSTTRQLDIVTRTHGRVLLSGDRTGAALHLLVGFHGYAQSAEDMLGELRAIPGAERWTIVSVQALHRFYRGRSDVTVASWMTRQDRDVLIDDNIAYGDAVLSQVAAGRRVERLVVCGFSQGVAMAFRAGVRGHQRADLIAALGGDVPPELLSDRSVRFPRVLLARGRNDDVYGLDRFRADVQALRERYVSVDDLTVDSGHEWSPSFRQAVGARLIDLMVVD